MAEYIEREALMRRIKEIHCAECDSYHGVRCRACWVDDTLDYIDCEPAADVAPVRHGRWKPFGIDSRGRVRRWNCTACHMTSRDGGNYCPYCGARMDGDDHEK